MIVQSTLCQRKMNTAERPKERVILGIDPGTVVMGYGVLLEQGQRIKLLDAGAVRFDQRDDHTLRLKQIFDRTAAILAEHKPDELAIEAQFFGKNVQSMLKLGRAQGVAIAAALQRQVGVVEYAPKRVKQAITGNGNATKEQVAAMLCSILDTPQLPSSSDATDAIAVALCHHFQGGVPRAPKGVSGWDVFVRRNPGRVR
jgi:crossover junction endodeoxyribonuclease RuvC